METVSYPEFKEALTTNVAKILEQMDLIYASDQADKSDALNKYLIDCGIECEVQIV